MCLTDCYFLTLINDKQTQTTGQDYGADVTKGDYVTRPEETTPPGKINLVTVILTIQLSMTILSSASTDHVWGRDLQRIFSISKEK